MFLKLAKYAYGSEYDLIHMNMSNCARILNMPESAKIYQMRTNMPQYV